MFYVYDDVVMYCVDDNQNGNIVLLMNGESYTEYWNVYSGAAHRNADVSMSRQDVNHDGDDELIIDTASGEGDNVIYIVDMADDVMISPCYLASQRACYNGQEKMVAVPYFEDGCGKTIHEAINAAYRKKGLDEPMFIPTAEAPKVRLQNDADYSFRLMEDGSLVMRYASEEWVCVARFMFEGGSCMVDDVKVELVEKNK